MSLSWWRWLHIAGALGFVMAHGVSVAVAFRLRRERDPARIAALLQLSSASIGPAYVGLLVLLAGGIVAGFITHAWGRGWIWTAIAILVLTSGAMYAIATPYYRKLRAVADAMASGSEAVTPEQLQDALRSWRPWALAGVGGGALLVILWLMVFRPF